MKLFGDDGKYNGNYYNGLYRDPKDYIGVICASVLRRPNHGECHGKSHGNWDYMGLLKSGYYMYPVNCACLDWSASPFALFGGRNSNSFISLSASSATMQAPRALHWCELQQPRSSGTANNG